MENITRLERRVKVVTNSVLVKVPIPDNWDLATPKIPDMQNVYDFPACRPHELQGGDFFPLNSASRFFIKDSGSLLGVYPGFAELEQILI